MNYIKEAFKIVKEEGLIKSLMIFNQRIWSPPFFTSRNKRYSEYKIGEWTYGSPKILFRGDANLKIGKFCSISPDVTIFLGGEHRIDWVTTYPFNTLWKEANSFSGHPRTKGDVIIGNDVWIGKSATILSGVKIGDGAVIGANSVVVKDVKPYEVVAGNPARHIKFRFNEKIINDLLEMAWWDWPKSHIEEALPFLLSANAEQLIKNFKNNKYWNER